MLLHFHFRSKLFSNSLSTVTVAPVLQDTTCSGKLVAQRPSVQLLQKLIMSFRNHKPGFVLEVNNALMMHLLMLLYFCFYKCYERQPCVFDSILSGFTVAWLHVSSQNVCVFFVYHYNLVSVYLSSLFPQPQFEVLGTACNISKQWWSKKKKMWKKMFCLRNSEWSAGYQQLHPCVNQYRISFFSIKCGYRFNAPLAMNTWVYRGMCAWLAHRHVLQVRCPLDITLRSGQWFAIFFSPLKSAHVWSCREI